MDLNQPFTIKQIKTMASTVEENTFRPSHYSSFGQIKTMVLSSCIGSLITIVVISFLLRNTAFVNVYLNNSPDPKRTSNENKMAISRRSYSNEARLILLQHGVKKGAVCLDGSPPGYYFKEGYFGGENNWIIHFFGGAWCFDEEACLQRSKTVLGSSKLFPPHPPKLQGILSSDSETNPDFYNWNLVMLCYCDGASFSGYRLDPVEVNGEYIYMRGRRILEVIIDQLLQSKFRNAQRVVLTGTSAGGMAVIIHSDFIRSKLPITTDVRAVADAGYFVDVPSINGGNIINRHFKKMFDIHNSAIGVNEECVRAAVPRYRWKCLFPQHTFRFIKTPVFVLQSAYDAWQMIHIRGINCQVPDMFDRRRNIEKRSISRGHKERTWAYKHIHGIYCKPPECTHRELQALMQFRNLTLHALRPLVQTRSAGLMLTSCIEHSQSLYDDTWNKIIVGGLSIRQAVGNWVFSRRQSHFHVDCPFPCNPSCSNVW